MLSIEESQIFRLNPMKAVKMSAKLIKVVAKFKIL